MNIEVVTMTPEWAQQILKQNTSNRSVRKAVVDKYAHDIKSGEYKLTHQGIAISRDGVLLDGQHRLLAVIKANTSITIPLATGCDPSIFSVLDTGATRKAFDVLMIEKVTNSTVVAASVRMYIMYFEHFNKIWQGRLRYPTNEDILTIYKSKAAVFDYATQKAKHCHRSFKQLTSGSAVAGFIVLAIDNGYPIHHIELFIQKLYTGSGLEETDPILRFRAAVFNGLLKSKGPQIVQLTLASLIKTFNFWNKGLTMRQFKVPNVPPMPLIDPYSNCEDKIYSITEE